MYLIRGEKRVKGQSRFSHATCGWNSTFHTSNESYWCPLSFAILYPDLLHQVTEWQTKMKRDACRPQENITVQSSKQNNPALMWKQGLPQISDCHLAVCWSWASYHTSSERGHPGLPADMKIRTIVQLIGILWSYFEHFWGLSNRLILMVWHLAISHWNQGYHVSFKRGHQYLSFSPNNKYIILQVSLLWLQS